MAEIKLPATLTFETALDELEQITHKLEEGRESLDSSIKLYEKGVALRDFCRKKLTEAEGKWVVLKKNKNGTVTQEKISSDKVPEPGEIQGDSF